MEIGKWNIRVGKKEMVSVSVIRELELFLNEKWKGVVLEEIQNPWWSVSKLGIPSPLIRVDMSPTHEPNQVKNSIYEVEVRPGGLGVFLSLSAEKIELWKEIFKTCSCRGFINFQSSIQDDRVVTDILGIPYYDGIPERMKIPYWLRTDKRNNNQLNKLEKNSLVPIALDGDKSYLVKLDMAKIINGERDLDFSQPFVIKPLIGARMEGVEIHIPSTLQKEIGINGQSVVGASTKSRISRKIEEGKSYLLQKFIPPQKKIFNEEIGWIIWRLFFGWYQGKYEFVGGLWTWRPNIRVHGTNDAIFGVMKEENFLKSQ